MGIVRRVVGWGWGEDYCNVRFIVLIDVGFFISLEFPKTLMVGIFRLGRT